MEIYHLKNILDQSIKEKRIYSFYEYGESTFYCGYVLSYNSDSVQVCHYTKYGEPDGTISLSLKNIRHICIQGEYEDGIEYLIKNQKEFSDLEKTSVLLSEISEGFVSLIKSYLNDRNIILNIEITDENYIGFVDDVKEGCFIFTEIDNSGLAVSSAIYKFDDISSVRVNDKAGRKALFLYKMRQRKINTI